MIEFFYHTQAGQTQDNPVVLKHHFTFGDYYQPTKFGRSTLRRADYIMLHHDYMMSAHRDYILLLYPFDDIDLKLNDIDYKVQKNHLSSFIIPKDTHIKFLANVQSHLILCECDIHNAPQDIALFDFSDTQSITHIDVVDIAGTYDMNAENKPFFGLILAGDIAISNTKLGFYDGFYTDNLLELNGHAKILTFAMPIPL